MTYSKKPNYRNPEDIINAMSKDELVNHLKSCPDRFSKLNEDQKDDEDVARTSILRNLLLYGYASERLKNSESFFVSILDDFVEEKRNISKDAKDLFTTLDLQDDLWELLPRTISDSEEVLFKAIRACSAPKLIERFSYRLRNDLGIARKLVAINPQYFDHLGYDPKYDLSLAIKAASESPTAFFYAKDELKENGSLLRGIYKNSIIGFFMVAVTNPDDVLQSQILPILRDGVNEIPSFYEKQFKKAERRIKKDNKKLGSIIQSTSRWYALKEEYRRRCIDHILSKMSFDEVKKLDPQTNVSTLAIQDLKLKLIPQNNAFVTHKKKSRRITYGM